MSGQEVRVLHVITQLELGGAQENTLYTVAHLRPPYHAGLASGPGGMLDVEARSLTSVETTFVRPLVRPIRPARDLLALLRLVRLFRSVRPIIVHTHSSKAGILGRLAARLTSVPIVVHSIHGYGFNDQQPAPLRRALIAAERLAAGLTTHFIVVSRANLEQGIRLGLFSRERATLIRSGIPIAAFEAAGRRRGRTGGGGLRRELGVADRQPLVGMVACLKPQKSPLAFVEVAAAVAALVPEAVFVLAGDGELRDRVRRRAADLGLQDRFRLLGWRRDVPDVIAALDVLVLTSLWEGLPKVVPQAIAAGVPVVATAVDGTTDIIEDGVNGLLAPPGDIPGLASRVARLLRDPALGRTMAARARSILPEFDIDGMVRAQEALYARLIEGRGSVAATCCESRT